MPLLVSVCPLRGVIIVPMHKECVIALWRMGGELAARSLETEDDGGAWILSFQS